MNTLALLSSFVTLAVIEIHVIRILVVVLLACIAWYILSEDDAPPKIAKWLGISIVVVFLLWLLADMGLIRDMVSVG